jgi:hypothetical protein
MYDIKSRDGYIEKVYSLVADNKPIDNLCIPHSDVFYVREALEARFCCELSLSQAEEYMKEAGWSDPSGRWRRSSSRKS